MCDPEFAERYRVQKESTSGSAQPSSSQVRYANNDTNQVFVQTGVATVTNAATESNQVRIILDGGSDSTFIKECVSREMQLPVVGMYKMSIVPFGCNEKPPARLCRKVKLRIAGKTSGQTIELTAIEVPDICLDIITPSTTITNDPRLKDLELSDLPMKSNDDTNNLEIAVLVGSDQYWRIVTGETRRISDDLVAVNTKIGWTLQGPVPQNVNLNWIRTEIVQPRLVQGQIQTLWDLEAIGISDEKENTNFNETYMNNSIEFENGRYKAMLPWKGNDVKLNSNYNVAKASLNSLTSRLQRQNRYDEYDKVMCEYFSNDIAELVEDNENESINTYYMPHRAVYREDKETTRTRIVFNASSHSLNEKSLNDQLLSGPNMIPDLFRILLNFRQFKIAITADIEKAFLQVSIHEKDRDSHRFLWYDCGELKVYRMKRLTFGVRSSPFILASVIKKHLKLYNNETARTLEECMYVDEAIAGGSDLEDVLKFKREAQLIFKEANMNLRKWYSNDKEVREHIGDTDIIQKVLGIKWYQSTDQIGIDASALMTDGCIGSSKREVLQAVARVFDPLGIISPCIITIKILLQTTWKRKIEWDATLPADLECEWRKWLIQVPQLESLTTQRHVPVNEETSELHIFADASPKAYGAVAYVKDDSGIKFLIAKNRVAPLKTEETDSLTLPKLELTAALIAARLQCYLRTKLNVEFKRTVLWSDSGIALHWIAGDPDKWKVYIKNRVKEIQEKTANCEWRHCPGVSNPADLLTRGVTATDLRETEMWFNGPIWLANDETEWPSTSLNFSQPTVVALQLTTTNENHFPIPVPLFPLSKFSSWLKVLTVTMYVCRFTKLLRRQRCAKGLAFTTIEWAEAEKCWVRVVQQAHFADELRNLRKNEEISRKSSILKLCPYLDDEGILRLNGRLQFADMEEETKHPAILPKKSILSKLMIEHLHRRMKHAGVGTILTTIRKNYWMIQGRQLVKSVLSKCIICRRLRGKGMHQSVAPLPKERVLIAKPFEKVGVDFAGPLYTNTNDKCYICLFTCAIIRAVHLELTPDLTAESFVRALRRFIARRGVPKMIMSDNAKTFKRASLELTAILEEPLIRDELTKQQIEWRFIVERAAWWGGWWERMVGSVKSALKAAIGRRVLTYDELQTILSEAEAIVNSRPLTYVSEEHGEPRPLTPADFLLIETQCGLNAPVKSTNSNVELTKVWQNRQKVNQNFWKRWSTEYLQQLRSAHEQNQKSCGPIKEGDIVLIIDQSIPRLSWKLARVTNVFPGRDGKIRACEMKLASGSMLRRPVQLLVPLELSAFPAAPEDVEDFELELSSAICASGQKT